MKPFFLASLSFLALAPAARAEKFTCSFTEPFVTITYETETQKLVRFDEVTQTGRIYNNVAFQVTGPNAFRFRDGNRDLLTLKLTGKGSNGMGETVYPYEGHTSLMQGPNGGVGGCVSSLLAATDGDL